MLRSADKLSSAKRLLFEKLVGPENGIRLLEIEGHAETMQRG